LVEVQNDKEDVDVTEDSCASQDARVKDLLEAIPQLRDTAKENTVAAQRVQKLHYDLKHARPTKHWVATAFVEDERPTWQTVYATFRQG